MDEDQPAEAEPATAAEVVCNPRSRPSGGFVGQTGPSLGPTTAPLSPKSTSSWCCHSLLPTDEDKPVEAEPAAVPNGVMSVVQSDHARTYITFVVTVLMLVLFSPSAAYR